MASNVRHSKLANITAKTELEKSAKSPFYNGENRVTGHGASITRTRTRTKGDKNSQGPGSGTSFAIKDKVLGGTTTGSVETGSDGQRRNKITADIGALSRLHSDNTTGKHRQPNRKIGEFRDRQVSKVERSRLGRRSTALRLSEVRNILAAAAFTAENSLPLNRHTTIHFDAVSISDPVASLRRYTKLARDWLRTQGAPFAYIWARESGADKGEHAHLLMHIPAHLIRDFARREPGWRKRIGAKRARGGFHSTPVGQSYRHAAVGIQHGQAYEDHLATIVGYLVKGAEQRAAKALRLERVQFGGELWGKRTGMSENIGRAARARAGIK